MLIDNIKTILETKNKKIKLPHIGRRTINTSLAVMICLTLGRLLGYPTPIFACIATVLTVRETVDSSVQSGITRILATLFGSVVGLLVLGLNITVLSPWLQIPIVGLMVLLTIYATVVIHRPDTTALTVIICIVIVLDHADDKYIYVLRRMIEALIGIAIALGVNQSIGLKPAEIRTEAPSTEEYADEYNEHENTPL